MDHDVAAEAIRRSWDALEVRIAAACERGGRSRDDVTCIAVSKGQSIETIEAAYSIGLRHFGENRPDELVAKAQSLPYDIVWHFVGQVQSRRAKHVAEVAATVHSVDRESLIDRLVACDRIPSSYVQVNIAREPQKGGVAPEDLDQLLEYADGRGLEVSGLMVIPPRVDTSEESRTWFTALRTLQEHLRDRYPTIEKLSMGMTDDFEIAIEEGATAIRLGRAIFGEAEALHTL